MNREEQIEQAAPWFPTLAEDISWKMGAKWADNNPSEANIAMYLGKKGWPLSTYGIPTYEEAAKSLDEYYEYKKKQWIDKTCEWIEENSYDYLEFGEAGFGASFDYTKLIEDFKNYMKGE